ncbi:hypothetical protein [Hahella sp. HN01]|uniref:hypothetical protein n=1 Tax=Hahella sp. HN01 TaxID=2847262 RepID=UPI001C1EF37F|nr:hypothetical protein [Hahella sp. HN01]MBU6955952.1 hypothetical protein [Hahella sp. HN01]
MIEDELSERIELSLSYLARCWRSANISGDEEEKKIIQEQYHDLFSFLVKWGWQGYLDPDSQLPEEYMPKEFLENDRYG